MKALVQEGSGSADALQLRDVPVPPVSDGRVLIKVHAASVNAADWHTVHGGTMVGLVGMLMRQPKRTDTICGGDVAGTVEAVGAGVTELEPGDEVFGTGRGTFAEYTTSRPSALARKPAQLSFSQAGAMGIAGITALQGLRDKGALRAGQRALVFGAGGGVGTFAVQIAKALGAHVTAVTGTRNLDFVRTLGADEVVDYQQEDVTRRKDRYDVVFDVAGTRPLGSLLRLLTPNGTLVIAGAAKRGGMLGIAGRIGKAKLLASWFKKRVVFYVAKITHEDLEFLARLAESGTLRPAIEHTYTLEDSREAVRYLGTGQARGKLVIEVA